MNRRVFFQMVDTLSMGGAERMSVNLASAMAEKGWESHLIISREGGGLEAQLSRSVQVHFLRKKSFADPAAFFRLVRLLSRYKPSVFHAHSTSIYWAVLLKVLAGRFLLVWHDHFGLSDQLDRYPRKDMVLLSKWIDRMVTVNDSLQEYWRSLLPYKSSTIQTIGNFAAINLPESKAFSKFTFLHLANFRPQKDHFNLVHAVDRLRSEDLNFEVLMVGEVVDAEYLNSIKAEIASLNLEEWISIHGPSSTVDQLLAQSHAGILSSESEGLPVALLEYGLASLPVICTEVGACANVISDPSLGLIVPPKDPVRLAVAMKQMLEKSNEDRSTMGKCLRDHVDKHYGKSAFLTKYFALLGFSG